MLYCWIFFFNARHQLRPSWFQMYRFRIRLTREESSGVAPRYDDYSWIWATSGLFFTNRRYSPGWVLPSMWYGPWPGYPSRSLSSYHSAPDVNIKCWCSSSLLVAYRSWLSILHILWCLPSPECAQTNGFFNRLSWTFQYFPDDLLGVECRSMYWKGAKFFKQLAPEVLKLINLWAELRGCRKRRTDRLRLLSC